MLWIAEGVVFATGIYLAIGLVFGLAFVMRGAGLVAPAARGSGLTFRLLILPGVAALWPLLWQRWRKGASE